MADPSTSYPGRTLTNGLAGVSGDEAQQIVAESLQEFAELQLWRATAASQWEEIAELVLPTSRNTFFYGNFNWPGGKRTERQIDATGMMALHRFSSICNSLITPHNSQWQLLASPDPYVMKDRATRLWFEQVTNILFRQRYAPHANFIAQNMAYWQSLGAFGNGAVLVEQFDQRFGVGVGLRYINVPLGELFIHQNYQGLVDGFCRWFRLTARQAKQKWPDTFPVGLQAALEAHSEYPYDFLHRVCPRADYDPQRIDDKGKPWASYYICLSQSSLMETGGYHSFPLAVGRYEQAPGEVYGRGPASIVLPALKTLNVEKTVFLTQGHRAAAPVLLTTDDGLADGFNMRPGALNKGGMSADGKPLVGVLPAGSIAISKDMMDEERSLINDAFLVSLFQILTETPQMSATEVIERVNEKGILIAPTVGRQESEYVGPLTDRELDLLSRMGMLPPMPPRLREARGEYHSIATSPLAKSMGAQKAAGFMRTLESAQQVAQITGDQSVLDNFNFDVAVPAIADIQLVPESWMSTDAQKAQQRQARAQAAQAQQQVQAAPAQAALIKAHAIAQKAGAEQAQQMAPGGAPRQIPTAPGVPQAQPPIPQGPAELQQ